MNKYYILLIITLLIGQKTFGQQDNDYYQKGLEIILGNLVQENPKIKFYLISNYYVSQNNNPQDLLDWFDDCDVSSDDLKQKNMGKTEIVFPIKFKKFQKKNNFLNKIIYSKNLVGIKVDLLYQHGDHRTLVVYVYEKSGGAIMLVQFKNDFLEINQFCKTYLIY